MRRMNGSVLGSILCWCLIGMAIPGHAADTSRNSDLALEYIKLVQEHVDNNWSYKKTLDNQFYSVQATVTINREGMILHTSVDRVSKDRKFNDEALQQLAEMEPFPRFLDGMQQKEFAIRLHLMPNAH